METHTPPPVDMEHLSLSGLRKLQAEVEAAILTRRKASQEAALVEIDRLVAEAELTHEAVIDHLSGRKRRRRQAGSKLPPKYRDPEDPGNTWAGRGKRPRWLEAKLEAGARLEDFRIPDMEQGP